VPDRMGARIDGAGTDRIVIRASSGCAARATA
jgi:UDP-N-acetylglucosamine enolpyruvyl transferase